MLSSTATSGANAWQLASWNELASHTYTSASPLPTASMHVLPMLPTATTRSPAHFKICVISDVVVVFPLVPVTATQRLSAGLSRQANSTSEITSVEAAFAFS